MPPRIDSPSIPDTYFSAENTPLLAPAALPRSSARSSAFSHVIRAGGQNLERFFASMNCCSSEPLRLDVTTQEGRANYKLAVRAWAGRPAGHTRESLDRKAIAERIDRWLAADDPAAPLDLSNSKLRSLPPLPSSLQSLNVSNAFGSHGPRKYPKTWPAGLRELNISNNKLTKLPDNLPDTLTILIVSNCWLKHLPKLPLSLDKLDVASNALDALPGEMPPRLRVLDARFNKLTGIPAEVLGTLTELYLSNNPLHALTQLPDDLTHLHLDGVRLRDLPPLPSGLVELSVKDNALGRFNRALPSGLRILEAGGNPFTELPSLPDTLERLSIESTLVSELPAALPANLGYLNISHTQVPEVSNHLLQAVGRPGAPLMLVAEGGTQAGRTTGQANQPAVGTANIYGVRMASLSLSQAVEAWYGAPDAGRSEAWDRIYRESQDGLANATVPLWKVLDSLEGTEDYPSEAGDIPATKEARNDMRMAFKQRVTDLLGAIENDKDLRKTCLAIADDRVESCHDNVALGFDEMEQAHLAARAIKGEFSQDKLFNMGKGRLKLLLLDELAIPKGNAVALEVAAELGRRPDQVLETVEVVLAYRLGLAERLGLPTKTKHMRYPATARVSPQDLLEAEAKVKGAIADDGRVASFMAGWRPWQVELERRQPEEFDRQALSEAEGRLKREIEELGDSYDNLCEEEGELGDNTLDTLKKINHLNSKLATLEDDMFREPRERLTKIHMGIS